MAFLSAPASTKKHTACRCPQRVTRTVGDRLSSRNYLNLLVMNPILKDPLHIFSWGILAQDPFPFRCSYQTSSCIQVALLCCPQQRGALSMVSTL